MAVNFSQAKIDEFKECFSFHAKKNIITDAEELSLIMRSLGYSPTKMEVSKYFQKYMNEERCLNFAQFLKSMGEHSQVEKPEKEILAAFKAHDMKGTGYVPASDLRHILQNLGEKLTKQEVDNLFHQFGVSPNGLVNYNDFVMQLLTPIPDY